MRTLLLLLLVLMLALAAGGPLAAAEPVPAPPLGETPSAGILVDASSGKVLWSHGEDQLRAPASLTKIMAALVAIERGDLDREVAIAPETLVVEGTKSGAKAGWTFTVRDLLWMTLLNSANDSALALAQAVSEDGTVAGFVEMMNARAAEMGAASTRFRNPHGLDDQGHVSTARDLALITLAAMNNPTFAEIVASPTHEVAWGDGGTHTLVNQNKLLGGYPGALGVKTGYTDEAGRVMISAAQGEHTVLVGVLLKAREPTAGSMALLDWGFENLEALGAQATHRLTPREAVVESASHGLKVVEVDKAPAPARSSPTGLLVGPLLALIGAVGVARVLRKPRLRPVGGHEPQGLHHST